MINENKIMVVTGASSGIGKALTCYFSSRGYIVCALARSEDALKTLVEESPGNVCAYPADVSNSGKVEETFGEIIRDWGRIDVLINNAGTVKTGNYWEQSIVDIDQMIDVNLKGTLYCTHATLNLAMIPQKSGAIININSVAGIRTGPKASVYQAAKHGQIGFGFSVAQAVIPYNVLVTTLCPGGINTPLWDGEDAPVPPDGVKVKDFMDPDEIAETVEFILQRPSTTLYKQMIFFPTCDWS